MIRSPMSFEAPYGDSGAWAVSSVTSSVVGVPKTAADPEKTSLGTPAAAISSSSVTVPTTLRR